MSHVFTLFSDNVEVKERFQDTVFKVHDTAEIYNYDFDGLAYLKGDRMLTHYNRNQFVWICLADGSDITGCICLRYSESVNGVHERRWIQYIEVHPSYRSLGLATALINCMFEVCNALNVFEIEQGVYTQDGNQYVKHVFARVADEWPNIKYIDPQKVLPKKR